MLATKAPLTGMVISGGSERKGGGDNSKIGSATVSKRGELRPKLSPKPNAKTSSITSDLVTVPRLFGPPQLLQGEDAAAYDELLGRVCAAIKPIDVIDEIFIDDLVSLQWELLRWRRLKSNLMRTCGVTALKYFLNANLDYDQYRKHFEDDLTEVLQDNLTEEQTEDDAWKLARKCARSESDAIDKVNEILAGADLNMHEILNGAKTRKAEVLARQYAEREPRAIKLIDKLLARANLSIEAVIAEQLTKQLDNIERVDRLSTIAENRRNAMLREIDRRRAALGEALRRKVQEVEGEFEVIDKKPDAKNAA
jgi:hypothetical protein